MLSQFSLKVLPKPTYVLKIEIVFQVEDNHEADHEHITLMNQVEEVLRERFTEEFYKTKAEVQTLHSTNKELLDGQEDIGALEAELDAKLSQVESCLEDLSLEQRGLVQSIKAIDNLDPEALDADKGIAFIFPEKYY